MKYVDTWWYATDESIDKAGGDLYFIYELNMLGRQDGPILWEALRQIRAFSACNACFRR